MRHFPTETKLGCGMLGPFGKKDSLCMGSSLTHVTNTAVNARIAAEQQLIHCSSPQAIQHKVLPVSI